MHVTFRTRVLRKGGGFIYLEDTDDLTIYMSLSEGFRDMHRNYALAKKWVRNSTALMKDVPKDGTVQYLHMYLG